MKQEGYQLVGLEQTTNSECLYGFRFQLSTVLVIGHERLGITDDVLAMLPAPADSAEVGARAGALSSLALAHSTGCGGEERAAAKGAWGRGVAGSLGTSPHPVEMKSRNASEIGVVERFSGAFGVSWSLTPPV
jgi:hypothetical protein